MANKLRKVKNKKAYIIRLLKKQGKYSPELSLQAGLVAQLLVRIETLAEEIFSDDYSTVNTELSREGNPRELLNPKDRLYLELMKQAQAALKALGMNTDSKERKTDNDSFSEFMQNFNEDNNG